MLAFLMFALDSADPKVKNEALTTVTNVTSSLRRNDESNTEEAGQAQALVMLFVGQ